MMIGTEIVIGTETERGTETDGTGSEIVKGNEKERENVAGGLWKESAREKGKEKEKGLEGKGKGRETVKETEWDCLLDVEGKFEILFQVVRRIVLPFNQNYFNFKHLGVQAAEAHDEAHEGQALEGALDETVHGVHRGVALAEVRDVVHEEALAEASVCTAGVHLLNDLVHV